MDSAGLVKKIKREKPNKKWSTEEIKSILNYLEDSTEIELPTAQIFYKKLILKTGIDVSWDLIRWKVRYLKSTFKKANDWRNSTGAGLLESDSGTQSVEAKILQMCPHYHQLNKIFGEKREVQAVYEVIDTGDPMEIPERIISLIEEPLEVLSFVSNESEDICLPNVSCEYQIQGSNTNNETTPDKTPTTSMTKSQKYGIPQKAIEFAEKIKKYAPKSSSAYLAAFQAERTSMYKMKFEWEKEKHAEEIELSKKKLTLDEEKTKADIEAKRQELELKAREIEKDERLKILEIEKDERIKMYEIEMRFKYQNQPT